MSLKSLDSPLHFKINPSRRLALILSLAHTGALLCVFVSPLSWWGLLALVLFVSLSWVGTLRRHVWWRHPFSVDQLLLDGEGQWSLHLIHRGWVTGVLKQGFYHPRVMVLVFVGHRRAIPLVLLPDSAHPEDLRCLRVELRRGVGRSGE